MTCLDCLGERMFILKRSDHDRAGEHPTIGSVECVYLCWDCGETLETVELTDTEWPIEREPVQ